MHANGVKFYIEVLIFKQNFYKATKNTDKNYNIKFEFILWFQKNIAQISGENN